MKKYVHIIFKAFEFKDTALIAIAKVIFVISLIVVFFMIGRIYEKLSLKSQVVPITIESSDTYCVLDLSEVSPLGIKGRVEVGDIRIIAGDEVISGNDMNFDLSTKQIFRSLEFVIPSNVKYFASKKGTKLYIIDNKTMLAKMNVQNLIFFKSLQNAKSKGYNF